MCATRRRRVRRPDAKSFFVICTSSKGGEHEFGGAAMMKVPQFRSGPAQNSVDYCTRRSGARALARSIEAAWIDSGHEVHCRVTPIRNGEGRILCYAITSDLRDGLPR